MRVVILKIKEGLTYLSFGLINDLKRQSQQLFQENAPLNSQRISIAISSFFLSKKLFTKIKFHKLNRINML
jgi:hypothetical protein